MNNTTTGPGGRPVVKEGDWVCQESRCLAINPQNRTTCESCGRTKPRAKGKVGHEIGKDAAEKSKGLFSAEDWACSKCGNINWSRRTQCNICNAPKFGEVEARTGYGGGYMDRQDVEYVQRDESDQEYDEFGRKKKKERPGSRDEESGGSAERRPPVSKGKEDDEDEDEEEEEDDGDLSKYMLDAEEADEGSAKSTPKNGIERKVEKKRSRSSSSSRSSSASGSYSSSSYSSSGSSSGSSRSSGGGGGGSRSNNRRRESRSGSRRNRSSSSRSGSRSRARRRRRYSSKSRSRSRSGSVSRSRSRSPSRSRSKRSRAKK